MANFYTSDHHFDHENILKFCAQTRPFASVSEMQHSYVQEWNSVVRPEDTVWYLGDFSMKFTCVQGTLARLNGTKHLIVGNHDKCFDMLPSQIGQYLQAGFASVQQDRAVMVGLNRFALCHFPYRVTDATRSADEAVAARQERFASKSLPAGELGEVALLHGHIHSHWRARVGIAALPEINVAVDAWGGRPVSDDQVLALYREMTLRGAPGVMDINGAWHEAPPAGSGE